MRSFLTRRSSVGLKNVTKEDENNNNKNNRTPTRPRPPPPDRRPPLHSRDHNASMRVQPNSAALKSKTGNAKMPPHDNKQNTTRPLMPTLSTSAKASNRSPLTRRVAGSTPAPASTPLTRRVARNNNNTTPHGSKDDIPTPVSTFLSSNITPRSGSRKSRVDSTNTTPSNTPNGTPVPNDGSGLGIAFDKELPKRPTVSFNSVLSDVGSTNSPEQASMESKFFVNDARSGIQSGKSSRPQPAKASSFCYANGAAIPGAPMSSNSSAVGQEERSQPKFFHADGAPDYSSPHFPPPRPSSAVSNNSRIASPRIGGTLSPPQRPLSPQKPQQPALKHIPSLPSPNLPRPSAERGQSASVVSARRVSLETPYRPISHKRSASAESPDAKIGPSKRLSGGSSTSSGPTTPLHLLTSATVSTPEEIPEEGESAPESAISELQSPIKAGHSIEQMNELAANARRERKVLDLEITNSSLTAINRTLERELRKQAAELRRYRRLSRSGRLSLATTASLRTSSGRLSTIDSVEPGELSDLSQEEPEEEETETSEDESLDDASLTSSAIAESDLRHRKKDEKRLQLDLSKHQQILVDSQRMNQSLKRCLSWTEELITEGRKALEYHVRVSDVELGGRVLVPDEDADNEGMSEVGAEILREARKAAANGMATWSGLGKEDRDSGIELREGEDGHPR